MRSTMVPVVSSASSLSRHRSPVMCGLVFALASPVLAQPASQAEELSRAYAALAAGQSGRGPTRRRTDTDRSAAAPWRRDRGRGGCIGDERPGWSGPLRALAGRQPTRGCVRARARGDRRPPGAVGQRARAARGRCPRAGGQGPGECRNGGSRIESVRRIVAGSWRPISPGVTGGSPVLRLRSLGQTGYRAAAPQVMELLAAREPEVRAAAADTLAALGARGGHRAAPGPLEGPGR